MAIDAGTGAERWRLSSTEAAFSPASVVDENIIVGTFLGEVMSVAQSDGHVNWTVATGNGAAFWAGAAIVRDEIYAVDFDGSLYALDAATGQEMWRVQLDGQNNLTPTITGGVIYVGTWAGSLYALGEGGVELPAATAVATPATPGPANPAAVPSSETVEADVELLWETTGGDSGFAIPSTLTFAPDGKIWVADCW